MKFVVVLGLLAAVGVLDQVSARLVDYNLRKDSLSASAQSLVLPKIETLRRGPRKTCQNSSLYLIYRYQFCFVTYTAGATESDDGWHLVYHRPKPFLSIVMPARQADSFYFREMVQGEYILFINRDGEVTYGDQR